MDHERTSPLERSPELAPSCIDIRGNHPTLQRPVGMSQNDPLVNRFDGVATHGSVGQYVEVNSDGPLPHAR
jgi:hypothetical protein